MTGDEAATPDAPADPPSSPQSESPGPALRIVRGDPSAEELAALTALVAASGDRPDEPEAPRRGRWNDPAWQHVRMPQPGPGAWASPYR